MADPLLPGILDRYRTRRAKDTARLAWLRLNAYGLLVVVLLLLRASALQPAWAAGFAVAGLFMLWGFIRSKTLPEVFGLGLLTVALTVQTLVVCDALDWNGQAAVRTVVIWVIVTGCVWLRGSAVLSKDGLTITIPGRATQSTRERNEANGDT